MVQVNEKYLVVDISGKVELYDEALFNALQKNTAYSSARLLYPGKGLISLVPRKYKNSEHIFKRLLKVIEGLLNYLYIISLCYTSRRKNLCLW